MPPHSNDTLVLPFSPFPHPRFTGLQKGSLYFGPHDTQERRIVSYRFSYRCVELCLFETLYPAPLAQPFSKGLLVSYITPIVPKHATYLPNESLSALAYRHPERSRGIFIALPPYAHIRPYSNDTLVLPFSPFPHPRFTGLQERSLHFGRDDRWKTDSLT